MSLVWFTLLMLAAYGAGAPVLWMICGKWESRVLPESLYRIIARLSIGCGILSFAALAMLVVSVGSATVFRILLPPLSLWGCFLFVKDRSEFRVPGGWWKNPAEVIGITAFVAVSLLHLRLAWHPVLLIDSWAYHIAFPRQYVIHGHLFATPYAVTPNFHFLAQLLNCWGFAWASQDMIFPKLQSVAAVIGAGLLIYLELRRRGFPGTGWVVAVLTMLMRENLEFAPSAHVDLQLAFYTLIGILVASRYWSVPKPARACVLILAGALLGFANGIKISGIAFSGIAGVAGVLMLLRGWIRMIRRGASWTVLLRIFPAGGIFGGAMLIVTAPWVIKNIVITGSPVYPFMPDFFSAKHQYDAVARDFLGSYNDFEGYGAFGIDALMGKVWKFAYMARVSIDVDQFRAVAVFPVFLLARLLRKPRSEGVESYLFMAGLLLMPVMLSSPARRFTLGPAMLYILASSIELTHWIRVTRIRFPGPALLLWAMLAVAAVSVKVSEVRQVWDGKRYVVRGSLPSGLFLTEESMTRYHEQLDDAAWVERIEREVGDGRLLTTEILPMNAVLRVKTMPLLNMHGPDILYQLCVLEGRSAQDVAEYLEGELHLTHVFTSNDMSSDTELQRLQRDYLKLIHSDGLYGFYRLRQTNQNTPATMPFELN